MSDWVDVSIPIKSAMVHWPGDPPVRIERASAIAKGDPANVSQLDMGAHTGTHMDAPVHFFDGEAGIDTMPIDAAVGPARVVEIRDPVSVKRDELELHEPRQGERLLLRTRNSDRDWPDEDFHEDFVYIAEDGAKYLVERGIGLVGVDYLSVGGFAKDAAETHVALLGAGVWVIESLDLRNVSPGDYELMCLPLRIVGADGAPARAALQNQPAAAESTHQPDAAT